VNTVTLKGGVSVLTDVLRLCWDLEAKGIQFAIDDDGRLLVGPASLLTAGRLQRRQAARHEIARIVRYAPPLGSANEQAPWKYGRAGAA